MLVKFCKEITLCVCLLFCRNLVAKTTDSYEFILRDGRKATIQLITDSSQIDKNAARTLLSMSFITEYQKYLKPNEIDAKLNYWFIQDGGNSVEQYYFDYFASVLVEFEHGKSFWLEAKINNKLVGWATYDKYPAVPDAHYMDLLIVDPAFQKLGIGTELVYAITKLDSFPAVKSINLLLRKKNNGGRVFYSRLGFKSNPNFTTDNFVDISLLEGWTLEVN